MSIQSEEASRSPSMAEEQPLLGREVVLNKTKDAFGLMCNSLIDKSRSIWASVSRKTAIGRVWCIIMALSCLSFWIFGWLGVTVLTKHTTNAYLAASIFCGSVSGIITFGCIMKMEDSIRRLVVDHMAAIRIVKALVNFLVAGIAAHHAKENVHDFSTAFLETTIPLSLGLIITTTFGMILEEEALQVLEGVGSAFEVLVVLYVSYQRLEAVFVSIFFFILCVLMGFYQAR